MKESNLVKFYCFLMICLSFMGFVGGIGYTLMYGTWVIAIGIVALGVLAFPVWNEYRRRLLD